VDQRARFWRSMAYLTSLGWLIVLPILAGVLVGHLVDQWLGSGFVWTLTLLLAGIGIAGLELYRALTAGLRRRDDA
jgi:ATP synthase protein I